MKTHDPIQAYLDKQETIQNYLNTTTNKFY